MSNTCTVTISGSAVTPQEGTLQITSRVDDKDKAVFTVIDSTGTLAFNKGQPVRITDSQLGLLFSGFINKPTCTNLFPSATNLWSVDCVNKFITAAKKATRSPSTTTGSRKRHRGGKHKNQHSGTIAANQIKEYMEPEGVTGNFGLDWTELQSDWQSGTLSGVAATTNTSTGNVGAGDLELAPTGSSVTFQQKTQADFNAGFIGAGGLATPATGGLTFAPTQAIKFTATESVPGVSSAALAMKIWSGSYTIVATDTLIFDVWTADSCPQQMASIDLIMSDGTQLSLSQATVGVDVQGVGPAINNDLAGLATNQWYNRRFFLDGGGAWVGKVINSATVSFGGTNQGDYTAYFRNIYILRGSTTTLTILSTSATATQTTPQPIANSGYSNISVSVVTTYERHGFAYSPAYNLSNAAIVNMSQVSWTITLPTSAFTYSITASIDNFTTFLPCANLAPIPGLLAGANLSGVHVQFVYVFDNAGNDPTLTPLLSLFSGVVNPSYTCTKSDIVNTTTGATAWNAGTLTNLNLSGTNTLQLNGYARNYDLADYSSQTLYGGSGPNQGVLKKQFFLQSNSGADARSRLDFAGPAWQNFTAEVDIVMQANVQLGFVYRTTGWQNNNDTYAYCAMVSTSQVILGHGTNSASGAGTFTNIQTVSVTFAANTTYHLKIIVNGNSHQVYVNDVLIINTTDSTYTAAGYLGMRFVNNTGGNTTGSFDNIGVMLALSGTWVSPAIDIHSLGTISNSQIILQTDASVNPSIVTFLVEISLNNGVTWSTCSNALTQPIVEQSFYFQSLPVPGLTAGTNVSSITQAKIRLTITTSTASVGSFSGHLWADIQAVSLFVLGAYSSTGSRSNAPMVWDSMTRLPVVSGWANASNGEAYAQVGTATTAVASNEATIANTTGDCHMVPAAPSSTDEDGTVRFQLSAATISAGLELRYTDANNYYRLVAGQNSLSIISKIRGIQTTLATATPTINTGTWYRLHFRVQGSGPINFWGNVYLDGTTEPSTWAITATQ